MSTVKCFIDLQILLLKYSKEPCFKKPYYYIVDLYKNSSTGWTCEINEHKKQFMLYNLGFYKILIYE